MTTTNKATKRQFLNVVEGIEGNWRTMTGGGLTSEVTRDWEGGSSVPDLLSGPPTAEDIEVTRTYDSVRDAAIVARLRPLVGRGRFTLTKQPLDANDFRVGKPITYPNCVLLSVTDPESDASSSDAAEFALTFATTGAV